MFSSSTEHGSFKPNSSITFGCRTPTTPRFWPATIIWACRSGKNPLSMWMRTQGSFSKRTMLWSYLGIDYSNNNHDHSFSCHCRVLWLRSWFDRVNHGWLRNPVFDCRRRRISVVHSDYQSLESERQCSSWVSDEDESETNRVLNLWESHLKLRRVEWAGQCLDYWRLSSINRARASFDQSEGDSE